MIRSALLVSLFLPAIAAAATAPCGTPATPPVPATVPAPEMYRAPPALAACVNVNDFTARARKPAVQQVAARETAKPAAAAPGPASAPAYKPKTEHDNSPWRFDMSQNGRRMTAEEFDAWMKAKGIRVATGKPGPATATATAAPAPAAAGCKVTATQKC
jgi:rare lipoprotein A